MNLNKIHEIRWDATVHSLQLPLNSLPAETVAFKIEMAFCNANVVEEIIEGNEIIIIKVHLQFFILGLCFPLDHIIVRFHNFWQ